MTPERQAERDRLADDIADWMIEYGPDGHCDGHETIARLVFDKYIDPERKRQEERAQKLVEALEKIYRPGPLNWKGYIRTQSDLDGIMKDWNGYIEKRYWPDIKNNIIKPALTEYKAGGEG